MFSQLLLLAESVLGVVAWLPRALLAWLRDWLHFRKLANRFPGPPTSLLVGNLFDGGYPRNAMTLVKWALDDMLLDYRTCQIWLGPVRIILLSDERDIQKFLMNSKNQSKPKLVTDLARYVLGGGIITENGDVWRHHHKIANPSFHHNLLNTYVSAFNRKSDIFVERLSEHANGAVFDVKHMTETIAVDITNETLFGVSSNQQAEPDRTFFDYIYNSQKELSLRLERPWLFNNRVYDLTAFGRRANALLNWTRGHLKETIKKRVEILQTETNSSRSLELSDQLETRSTYDSSSKKKPKILIDAILQDKGESIFDLDVVDNLQSFYLAGFDTAAITLQFALYYLAKNPMVQEKAMTELRKIFDAAGSTQVTPDVLQQMQYVEMIVKETLRMHPPVFFFMRRAGEDTPLASSDLVVPAGADVVISPRTVHLDPKLYPDPHVFDPERFSPENCAKRQPGAYIPFAMGARGCIGKKYAMMEIKTIIGKTIWNYRVLPDEAYEPRLQWGITMVTSNGMKIRLLKRENEY